MVIYRSRAVVTELLALARVEESLAEQFTLVAKRRADLIKQFRLMDVARGGGRRIAGACFTLAVAVQGATWA